MTGPLAHRAETQRLARVLGVAPDELDFLQEAPVEALAELRAGILDRLLERSREEFERAVALGDKLPRGLAATLAEHAMGPVLGGRAAALLRPEMAVELAKRLPAEFLADVATHVDLRHVGPLVGGIPTKTMAGAGKVLRAREEWIVLSAFVGHVPSAKLEALLELFDGEALLRAGFVIDDVDRLDPVVALLPDARLDELLAAAHEHELWREAVALAVHLHAEQRTRVIAAIERRPPAELDGLLRVADEEELWDEVILVARQLPAAFLADMATKVQISRVGPLVAGLPSTTIAPAGQLLGAREEWSVLAQFVGHVPDETLRPLLELFDGEALLRAGLSIQDADRLDAVVALLSDARLDELLQAAHAHQLWREAIGLAGHLQARQRERLLVAIERRPAHELDDLLRAADRDGLWAAVISVAGHVPSSAEGTGILGAMERLDEDHAAALAAALGENDELRAGLIARAPDHLLARLEAR